MSFSFPLDADHDSDRDGISDALESALAEMYAPIIYLDPGETNYPVNVAWFLERAQLHYYEDDGTDCLLGKLDGQTTQERIDYLVGRRAAGPYNHGSSWPQPHPDVHDGSLSGSLTSIEPDPNGRGGRRFYFADLDDGSHGPVNDRLGLLDPSQWETYVHVFPRQAHTFAVPGMTSSIPDGGITLSYYHLFPYNGFGVGGRGDHGGDWDATMHVILDAELQPVRAVLSRHDHDSPGDSFDWSRMHTDGTHPIVVVTGGGHATFADPQDATGCLDGTVDGWRDHPTDAGSGTVWRTWSGQVVLQTGSCIETIDPGKLTPPLVNLGEYNPGAGQLCRLGAPGPGGIDSTCITPGCEWLAFSGRWGSPSVADTTPLIGRTAGTSGRSPVWQGDRIPNTYAAWYFEGADALPTSSTHPWLQPPNLVSSSDAATATVTAAATANRASDHYAPVRISVDVTAVGGTTTTRPYAGPFVVNPGERVSLWATDAFGQRSARTHYQRSLTIAASVTPVANDRAVAVLVTAVDTMTHQPVSLPVTLSAPTTAAAGSPPAAPPHSTNRRWKTTFPSTDVYDYGWQNDSPSGAAPTSGSANTGPRPMAAGMSFTSFHEYGHFPLATVDAPAYAQSATVLLGPADPALTKMSGWSIPADTSPSDIDIVTRWLDIHGEVGGPLPREMPGISRRAWAKLRTQIAPAPPTR